MKGQYWVINSPLIILKRKTIPVFQKWAPKKKAEHLLEHLHCTCICITFLIFIKFIGIYESLGLYGFLWAQITFSLFFRNVRAFGMGKKPNYYTIETNACMGEPQFTIICYWYKYKACRISWAHAFFFSLDAHVFVLWATICTQAHGSKIHAFNYKILNHPLTRDAQHKAEFSHVNM